MADVSGLDGILASLTAPVVQLVEGVVGKLTGQARNFAAALSFGAMAGGASRNVGVGYAVLKYLSVRRPRGFLAPPPSGGGLRA